MAWKELPTERTLPCNGEMVKYHRNRRGWTQQELAKLSGYAIRLIGKAEASGTVERGTIDIIAQTLSGDSLEVHPEDLVFFPKVAARQMLENFAKYERDCASHCNHLVAEDVQFLSADLAEGGSKSPGSHAAGGSEAFWQRFYAAMERLDKASLLDSTKIVAEGNKVVVMSEENVRSVGDHKPSDTRPLVLMFEFERGKLKRLRDHFDV